MLCLLLVWRIKTKKEKRNTEGPGDGWIFPKAGHALLAVVCGCLRLLGAIKGDLRVSL
jgi:hypothetical protein